MTLPPAHRLIAGEADLQEGMAALGALDPRWQALIDRVGLPPLRRREGGFAGLCAIIVAQQLSVQSARAVWTRVDAKFGPVTPERILAASSEELGLAGLTRPKQRAMRAAAQAVIDRTLDFAALEQATPRQVHDALTAISGIGPWTADIYLLFSLGHGDGFAAGDLAIQEAARHAFGLATRPTARELEALAETWRPWRGVAARLLWAYYAVLKNRQGIDA